MINVIIADHQPIYRAGIAKLLASEDDLRIIAQPLSVAHLLNAIEKLRPRVLILSSGFLPGQDRIQEIAAIAGARQIATLVLAENTEKSPQFVPLGVQGVFYRSVKSEMLVQGVRRLARGGRYVQMHAGDEISNDLVGERVSSKLSRRELTIIAGVVQGLRNRAIAEQLGTSEQTIKKKIRTIFDKTGVSGRLELALFVVHHQVLAQATAAEHLNVVATPVPSGHKSSEVRAVQTMFFPPAKLGRSRPLLPNQVTAAPGNHSWHHPIHPDCGK